MPPSLSSPPEPQPTTRSAPVRAVTVVALALGLWAAWRLRSFGPFPASFPWEAGLGLALAVGLEPAARKAGSLSRAQWASLVGAVGFLVLVLGALTRDREPKLHDEMSYLLQARMLLSGRLWMTAHPVGEFFEAFNLLFEPVYASAYFPGTALLYALPLGIGLPPWIIAALTAGVAVGLLAAVTDRLLDRRAALLAGLMLVSVAEFRRVSILWLSQGPLIALVLGCWLAWLSWRETPRPRRAALLGLLSGWAVLTRPLDAACLLLPVSLAFAWRAVARRDRLSLACAVLAALPFALLQAGFNFGATGSVLHSPFSLYAERDNPGTSLGSLEQPSARPASRLPQKQVYHDEFTLDQFTRRGPLLTDLLERRIPDLLGLSLPHALLALALPFALLSRMDRRLLVLLLGLPLLALGYGLYPYDLPHYRVSAAPALLLAVLCGLQEIERRLPGPLPRTLGQQVAVVLCALSFAAYGRDYPREILETPVLRAVDAAERALPGRALLLINFPPGSNPHEEPVYNWRVAWPDQARVVRAHDLGPDNRRLFDYYARTQPERVVYSFDRASMTTTRLGPVTEVNEVDEGTERAPEPLPEEPQP